MPTPTTTLRVTTTGALAVLRGTSASSTVLGTSGATGLVAVNTWVYIELQAKLADSPDGAVDGHATNGTARLTLTGIDTNDTVAVLPYDVVELLTSGPVSPSCSTTCT